jgi:hypothetical protein
MQDTLNPSAASRVGVRELLGGLVELAANVLAWSPYRKMRPLARHPARAWEPNQCATGCVLWPVQDTVRDNA